MVRRVLIQGGAAATMRCSLPGYDVVSATPDQTCFDARWSGFVPYLKGTVQTSNDVAQNVFFGETLDVAPFFAGYAQSINITTGLPDYVYGITPFMFRGGGEDYWVYVLTTTSYMQFRAKYDSSPYRLTYTLFKRPAG
jgi:hypothetical protein